MVEREKMIEMVTAFQNGNEDAAISIYNTFRDDLYYFILKTVNDENLAEDLTQDTFIEILQTIKNLKEPAAFPNWSRKIAYHRCTAYFRKRKELLEDENEEGNSVFDTIVEEREEFIPDEALDKDEFKKTIQNMIDELPKEQRSAIMMRYFDEISVKEIAEIQGVTEGTVKSRLNYGRKAIKDSVEEYEKKHGVKLHSIGIIPILLWFFKEEKVAHAMSLTSNAAKTGTEAVIRAQAKSVLHAEIPKGAGAALKGSKVVVSEAAKAGASKLAVKIMMGILAAGVAIGGGAAIYSKNQNNSGVHESKKEENTGTNDEIQGSSESTDTVGETSESEQSQKADVNLNDCLSVVGSPAEGYTIKLDYAWIYETYGDRVNVQVDKDGDEYVEAKSQAKKTRIYTYGDEVELRGAIAEITDYYVGILFSVQFPDMEGSLTYIDSLDMGIYPVNLSSGQELMITWNENAVEAIAQFFDIDIAYEDFSFEP